MAAHLTLSRTHGVPELRKPKRGQLIWMIINGEPTARFFYRFYSTGCRVSQHANLAEPIYHDLCLFFESELDAITFLLGGALNKLADAQSEVKSLCGQLCAAAKKDELSYGR